MATKKIAPVIIDAPQVKEEDVAAAEDLINDVLAGNVSLRDRFLKYVRTYVPYGFALLITWVSSFVPAIGDFYNSLSADSKLFIFSSITFGIGTLWYWVGNQLGKKWPLIEKIMLGSAKKPVGYSATK